MTDDRVKFLKKAKKQRHFKKNGVVDIYTNYIIFRNVEIFEIPFSSNNDL
jgi:hypothetical protein